ncbi:orotidine-5'-phosphate decarboxylase [soil metagenome]
MKDFLEKLSEVPCTAGSRLCIGLDPEPSRLPASYRNEGAQGMAAFCLEVARITAPFARAFKLNLAFFEALGWEGYRAMEQVIKGLPETHIVIADGKRGDIGNTSRRYADAMYDVLGVDACTVNPYMGSEAIAPFLSEASRAAFVLTATSNPSAAAIQDAQIGGKPFYLHVARTVEESASPLPGTLGFVVGATRPDALALMAREFPGRPLLVPGVGAQGASMRDVARALTGMPALINVGRSILYASSGEDFGEAAARAAEELAIESIG